MKKVILLITIILSINVLAKTETQQLRKAVANNETSKQVQIQPLVVNDLLKKPTVNSASLFQVTMAPSCWQMCMSDYRACVNAGNLRFYCLQERILCLETYCP